MSFRSEAPVFKESVTVEKSSSAGTVPLVVSNTSNTASSDASITVKVAGTSANDPFYVATVNGTQSWSWGIDNSDSDKFKLGHAATIGSNTAFEIDTSKNITFFSDVKFDDSGNVGTLSWTPTASRTLTLPDATASLAERSAPIEASRYKNTGDAAYTVTDTDGFDVIYSGTTLTADRTVTLPTAADNAGRMIVVKKADSGAFDLIVDGEGAETIDGATTVSLVTQYDFIKVVCDGSNWHIIEKHIKVVLETKTAAGPTSDATAAITFSSLTTGDMYRVTFAGQMDLGDNIGKVARFTVRHNTGATNALVVQLQNQTDGNSGAQRVNGTVIIESLSGTTIDLYVENDDSRTATNMWMTVENITGTHIAGTVE